MLFKALDRNGKFIQYISLCISEQDMQNGVNTKNIINELRNSNMPYAKQIIECNIDYFNWSGCQIIIQCYDRTRLLIQLNEILSSKRMQDIKNRNEAIFNIKPSCIGDTINAGEGYNYIATTTNTNHTISINGRWPANYFTTRPGPL